MRRRPVQLTLLVLCIVAAFFVEISRLVDEQQNTSPKSARELQAVW